MVSVSLWYAHTLGTRTYIRASRLRQPVRGPVRTQVGRKRSILSRSLAKGMGDKTVGKPPTQQCGTGNGVEEPRQTGSPAVICTQHSLSYLRYAQRPIFRVGWSRLVDLSGGCALDESRGTSGGCALDESRCLRWLVGLTSWTSHVACYGDPFRPCGI